MACKSGRGGGCCGRGAKERTLLSINLYTCKEAGLCNIGKNHICSRAELSKIEHRLKGNAIVEKSVICHYRVHKDFGAISLLMPSAIVCNKLRLILGGYKACAYCIKGEAQLVPYSNGIAHICSGIQYIKLAIIKSIGDQCRRQVKGLKFKMREDWYHHREGHLAVTCQIVYQKYFVIL